MRYGYTGGGDTADLALCGDLQLLTRIINLPGGVLHTWRAAPTERVFDHPSVRGDLTLSTDSTGRQVGELRSCGPYGEPLGSSNDGMPNNQPGTMDYGWLGEHQRSSEHAGALSIVQMGARPHSPVLGRSCPSTPSTAADSTTTSTWARTPST